MGELFVQPTLPCDLVAVHLPRRDLFGRAQDAHRKIVFDFPTSGGGAYKTYREGKWREGGGGSTGGGVGQCVRLRLRLWMAMAMAMAMYMDT